MHSNQTRIKTRDLNRHVINGLDYIQLRIRKLIVEYHESIIQDMFRQFKCLILLFLLCSCNAYDPNLKGNVVIYRPIRDQYAGSQMVVKMNSITCSLSPGTYINIYISKPQELTVKRWGMFGSDEIIVNPGDNIKTEFRDRGIFVAGFILTKTPAVDPDLKNECF